jgi:hypothetical protein
MRSKLWFVIRRKILEHGLILKGVSLKTTCPKCETKYDISDKEILAQIERSPKLRSKVAALLGRLTGGQTKLDAEGRRQRALKAVQAREERRNNPS